VYLLYDDDCSIQASLVGMLEILLCEACYPFFVEAKTLLLLDAMERAAGQYIPVEFVRYLVMHHCILCPFKHT